MTKTASALPKPAPRRVNIGQLSTDTATFQPRFGGLQERHVASLIDALKRGTELDPVAVWQDPETGELIVADGHHRLEAMRRYGSGGRIKVDVYSCDRNTALLIPMRDNAKNRLALTYHEKANWAWRLVAVGAGHSKKQTATICGISDRTIGTMRKIAKELQDREELLPVNWLEAQRLHRDEEDTWSEDDRDARKEAAIAKADEQFGGALAELCGRWPDAAAELIRRCAGKQLGAMLDCLGYAPTCYQDLEYDPCGEDSPF